MSTVVSFLAFLYKITHPKTLTLSFFYFVRLYPSLKRLIHDCWQHKPSDRPDFDAIVQRLGGEVAAEVNRLPEPDVNDEQEVESSEEGAASEADGDNPGNMELTILRKKVEFLESMASAREIKALEVLAEERLKNLVLQAKLNETEMETKRV